jgi:hypothetical protein
MANNRIDREDTNTFTSFGERAVPQPNFASARAPAGALRASGGNDPYNTSGSFDRSKNWERVRKR